MWNPNNFNGYQPYNNFGFNPYQQQQYQQATNQNYNYQPNTAALNNTNSQVRQGQDNIIWVEGKQNARAMQLAPNSRVILLDSEQGKFYIKTTDDIGLGRLRIFNYTEEADEAPVMENAAAPAQPAPDMSNYITRDELISILKEFRGNNHEEQFVQGSESTTKKQPIIISRKQ